MWLSRVQLSEPFDIRLHLYTVGVFGAWLRNSPARQMNSALGDIQMKANELLVNIALPLALLITAGSAHALFGSDACRDVIFSVDNNFGRPIVVERFELFSASEGRWLNENFRDMDVPAGEQNFVVRNGEAVEYGENDRITEILVHFRWWDNRARNGRGGWVDERRVDREIARPICVAGKRYRATIER